MKRKSRPAAGWSRFDQGADLASDLGRRPWQVTLAGRFSFPGMVSGADMSLIAMISLDGLRMHYLFRPGRNAFLQRTLSFRSSDVGGKRADAASH
jgi:hypothetical protein